MNGKAFCGLSTLRPMLAFGALLACCGLAQAGALETANVMAPLQVQDWQTFKRQLQTVKGYGVDAVSVDVWWGAVERAGDNQFDWDDYDRIFSEIKASGLKIVPILSFHQCGGNVGDTCDIPLPPWLWQKYLGKTLNGAPIEETDLQYKSEQGHSSREVVQLWADPLVADEYRDFVQDFKRQFADDYGRDFIEINVSAGPSGELRYPSYNAHDSNAGYPTRGALQAYSRLAIQDFQAKMLAKYGSLAGVNDAWKTRLSEVSQIQPPSDAKGFFERGDDRGLQYGRDFVDWYNQSLVDHGDRLLTAVIGALGDAFPGAEIGYKIPGVHWTMSNPAYPRAAEVAAGLIQTSLNLDSDAGGHGYAKVVGLAKRLSATGRDIVLHFTCLEMGNESFPPQYSRAQDLVFWVAQEAERQGVTIKGENALAGGIRSDAGWDRIENAFRYAAYSGLTTLRIGDVASGTGQARYADFIRAFRPSHTGNSSLDERDNRDTVRTTGGLPEDPARPGGDTWYFRGTPNAWGAKPMAQVDGGDVWATSVDFMREEPVPRFKIDHRGDWTESYPARDYQVQEDCARYAIRFDRSSKAIVATRVDGITSGACASDGGAASAGGHSP